MTSTQQLLKFARLFHLYSGVFLAPALLFFAFTGGVQTFSLHETTRGRAYTPPAILVELGQLHKKQTVVVPTRRPPQGEAKPDNSADSKLDRKHSHEAGTPAVSSPEPVPSAAAPTAPTPRTHNLLPMKIFFLIVATGLFLSTLTGLWMAYRFAHRKRNVTLVLAAGIVIPLLLLLF